MYERNVNRRQGNRTNGARHYGSRGRRRRRSRVNGALVVLTCFMALAAIACVSALYIVFHADDKNVVQASKGHKEPDVETLVSEVTPEPAATPIPAGDKKALIVIDPGHGGWDNGCSRDGVVEQEVNLEISLLLNQKLKDMGYNTLLIREDNETGMRKEDRVEVSKEAEATLYVSVHQNSYGEEGQDNSVTGVETYYTNTNGDSITLAQLIQDYVSEKTGARNRGVINLETLYVIRENTCPSCLIETGFLTNEKERKLLSSADYQEKIASGIAQGIKEFLEGQEK